MVTACTISITVDRPWGAVYEAIWRPERFADWASGLSRADLRFEDGRWQATGSGGPVTIEFTPHNPFGVMDHTVHLDGGLTVFVPLRVVPNRGRAEVMLTLFTEPGTPADIVARDVAWIERDLATLKHLLES